MRKWEGRSYVGVSEVLGNQGGVAKYHLHILIVNSSYRRQLRAPLSTETRRLLASEMLQCMTVERGNVLKVKPIMTQNRQGTALFRPHFRPPSPVFPHVLRVYAASAWELKDKVSGKYNLHCRYPFRYLVMSIYFSYGLSSAMLIGLTHQS